MALNGAEINCWAKHERSPPEKVRRVAKEIDAPQGRLRHWQPPGKVMVSNDDDQLIVRWAVALDCAGHSGPEFQVVFYFLAGASRLRI